MINAFMDKTGRVLFVHSGLGGDSFGTFYQKRPGSFKRCVSPDLPMRPSREQAEKDLEELASWRGWAKVQYKII